MLEIDKFSKSKNKILYFRIIELGNGADVFMHYLKCYQDYGDIIKEAISKSRNLDQVTSAHTLVLALRKQYLKLLDLGKGHLDKSSADFTQLKVSNIFSKTRERIKFSKIHLFLVVQKIHLLIGIVDVLIWHKNSFWCYDS